MNQSEGKIGIKEYMGIIFIAVGTKLSDDTPYFLFKTAKNSAWISFLLIGILSIIPTILLITVLSAHKEKNLYEVTIHLFGKGLGNVISFGMLCMGFSALVFDSSAYAEIISSIYFTKTPFIAILIVLLIVCGYGAKMGLAQIGSTAWLTFFYLKVTLFLALLLAVLKGDVRYVFPLLGPGIKEIVKTAGTKMSIYADFYYLGLIAPMVKSFKEYRKGTMIAFVIVTIEITISLLVFIMVFDYTSIEILKNPFHEMILYLSFGFLTNMESIFLPFWLMAAFIRFAVYLYLVVLLFGNIFKIKEFEYLVPVMVVLVVFSGAAPRMGIYTIPNLKNILLAILSPIFFALPCLMWLIAKVKGDFNREASTTKS